MFSIFSADSNKVVFCHQVGSHFNFAETVNNVRQNRWKSELVVQIDGQELDYLIHRGILKNEGQKSVQKTMMIGDVIKVLGYFVEARNSYSVA